MSLLEKLAKLKEYFLSNHGDTEDVGVIDGWIVEAKRLLLLQSLAEHDGIKYVFKIFQDEVSSINSKLLGSDSKTLPDYDRDRLLDRRALAQKYLDLFLSVNSDLEKLEEVIDQEDK